MSDYLHLSMQEKMDKYHEFDIAKLAFMYELSDVNMRDLINGVIKNKWRLNCRDFEAFIDIIIQYIDDGLIYQFISDGNKQSIKWSIEQHNVWTHMVWKGLYFVCICIFTQRISTVMVILYTGYIKGNMWIQKYANGKRALCADLRHNFGAKHDISMPYFSFYFYHVQDNGIAKPFVTMYEDELPIEPKGKERKNKLLPPGYAIISLEYPHIGPIEIRFSAAWHDPFEHFWIIKKIPDYGDEGDDLNTLD